MESFKEQLQKFEEVLDSYENQVGLDKIVYNSNVEKILLLDEDQFKNLEKSTLEEYSFLLIQYSAVLHKENNRNKVRLYWAENQLHKLIAKQYNKYCTQYMKYEIVKSTIINNDSAAAILDKIILHAQSRILEIEDVISNIEMMSKILSNIGRYK